MRVSKSLECLAAQAFVDEIRACAAFSSSKDIDDALAMALDFKAAFSAAFEADDMLEQQVNKITGLVYGRKWLSNCWNCGEHDHVPRDCKRTMKTSPVKLNKKEN